MMSFSPFMTALGVGFVEATERGICRVQLPGGDTRQMLCPTGASSLLTDRAAEMLTCYFRGTPQPFESLPIDCMVATDFRRMVIEIVRRIPYGGSMSYGQVAAEAGSASASRAVGRIMAVNPVPVIVPCHRVVAADGALTGFSAPGGLELKKSLLIMEGIEISGQGMRSKIVSYKQQKLA